MQLIGDIMKALALRRLALRARQIVTLAQDTRATVYPVQRRPGADGPERVVVVTPHADDETFGAGGAIALHVDAGDEVSVLLCSDNIASVTSGMDAESAKQMRNSEYLMAMQALGVRDVHALALDDAAFALQRQQAVEAFVIGKNPTLLYLPSLLDNHTHHRAVNAWMAPALDALAGTKLRVRGYEVWSPCSATVVIDISTVLDRKRTAIDAYASQCAVLPYRAAIEGLNAYRALTLEGTATHAEAFHELPAAQYLELIRQLL
jgi:LmbE family N-acetylglucosaminyl deacetylase